jgi:hypothetical protein
MRAWESRTISGSGETWRIKPRCGERLDINADLPCGNWHEMRHYGLSTGRIVCGVHNGLDAGDIT